MNAKKAKLMRKVGKIARRDKKLYNTLSHQEKTVLGDVYKSISKAKKLSEE
jgi:hypothetical protein